MKAPDVLSPFLTVLSWSFHLRKYYQLNHSCISSCWGRIFLIMATNFTGEEVLKFRTVLVCVFVARLLVPFHFTSSFFKAGVLFAFFFGNSGGEDSVEYVYNIIVLLCSNSSFSSCLLYKSIQRIIEHHLGRDLKGHLVQPL